MSRRPHILRMRTFSPALRDRGSSHLDWLPPYSKARSVHQTRSERTAPISENRIGETMPCIEDIDYWPNYNMVSPTCVRDIQHLPGAHVLADRWRIMPATFSWRIVRVYTVHGFSPGDMRGYETALIESGWNDCMSLYVSYNTSTQVCLLLRVLKKRFPRRTDYGLNHVDPNPPWWSAVQDLCSTDQTQHHMS